MLNNILKFKKLSIIIVVLVISILLYSRYTAFAIPDATVEETYAYHQIADGGVVIWGSLKIHMRGQEDTPSGLTIMNYPSRFLYYHYTYSSDLLQYKTMVLTKTYHYQLSTGSKNVFSDWNSEATILPNCTYGQLLVNYTQKSYLNALDYEGRFGIGFYDASIMPGSIVLNGSYNLNQNILKLILEGISDGLNVGKQFKNICV